jgi:hypothetical protein
MRSRAAAFLRSILSLASLTSTSWLSVLTARRNATMICHLLFTTIPTLSILPSSSLGSTVTYDMSYDPFLGKMTLMNSLASAGDLQFNPLVGPSSGTSISLAPGSGITMNALGQISGTYTALEAKRTENVGVARKTLTILNISQINIDIYVAGFRRTLLPNEGWEVEAGEGYMVPSYNCSKVDIIGCQISPSGSSDFAFVFNGPWAGAADQARFELLTGGLSMTDDTGNFLSIVTPLGYTGCVPEIDPATGGSAFSLIAGVLAMTEQRRRRGALSTSLAA